MSTMDNSFPGLHFYHCLKHPCYLNHVDKNLDIVIILCNITTSVNTMTLSFTFEPNKQCRVYFFSFMRCFKQKFPLFHNYDIIIYVPHSFCHRSELLRQDDTARPHTNFHAALMKREAVICYTDKWIKAKYHCIKAVDAKFHVSSITLYFSVCST